MDFCSLTKAVGSAASPAWQNSWPDGLFRRITSGRFSKPVLTDEREDAVHVTSSVQDTGGWRAATCTGSAVTHPRLPAVRRPEVPGGAV